MLNIKRWLTLALLGTLAVPFGLAAAGWAMGNMIKWHWAPWFLVLQAVVGVACAAAGFGLWARAVVWGKA
ncbi:MAG: hypothetical protein WC869_10560 [Phycisphaerae bacterium]|jgi:hypothetical protein